jgi:hypothetical protein
MTSKWTASCVFAEKPSRLLPSYPLAYCQRLEPLIGTGDLSRKWLLSSGFSPLLGFNNAYRSHNLECVFPAFREELLAVEIVSAKIKGAKIRSSLFVDTLGGFSGKVKNFF